MNNFGNTCYIQNSYEKPFWSKNYNCKGSFRRWSLKKSLEDNQNRKSKKDIQFNGRKKKQGCIKHCTEHYRSSNTNRAYCRGKHGCFRRECSPYSTSATCRVTIVTNLVIKVIKTYNKCNISCSFLPQLFSNCTSSNGGDRKTYVLVQIENYHYHTN